MVNNSVSLNVVKFDQTTALDIDIDRVVAQYTEISQSINDAKEELDLIEEFQLKLGKLYELNARVNFLNKEISYVLGKRK